jgi:hypothetical protein
MAFLDLDLYLDLYVNPDQYSDFDQVLDPDPGPGLS